MNKVVLSAILGLLSPFVFIIGAEPVEVRGENSVKEIPAGCVALTLYLRSASSWSRQRTTGAPRQPAHPGRHGRAGVCDVLRYDSLYSNR